MSNTTVGDGFARFGKMCPADLYVNFYDGLCKRIQVSGFYANCLQYGLVTLMYLNVGKGRYWKILYYASLAGLIGGLVENGVVAYVCTQSDANVPRYKIIPFLLNEFFWIIKEYSVPFLNLIKLRAFTNGKRAGKVIDWLIYILFGCFVVCRLYIGYVRYDTGLLSTERSKLGHTAAFVVMALADIICTVAILYFVHQHNRQSVTYGNNLDHYIQRSSYMTLIFVDLVGVILAFFNFTTALYQNKFPSSYINPFQAVKSSFILILACDAMVFKYSITSSSRDHGSSYNNYGKENFSSNYNLSSKMSQSRSIVKNYTNNVNPVGNNSYFDVASPTASTLDHTYMGHANANNNYLHHASSGSQNFGFLS